MLIGPIFNFRKMTQIIAVTRLILEKLILKYNSTNLPDIPTKGDRLLADKLFERYEALFYCDNYNTEETLDFDNDRFLEFDDEDQMYDDYDHSQNYSEESQSSQEWQLLQMDNGECFELDFINKVLNYYDSVKEQKFQKTKNRYPKVKHCEYIRRFRQYSIENGTKGEKFKKIEDAVLKLFLDSRSKHFSVHDIDLRRWALMESKRLKFQFVASSAWCYQFKKRNRIVGRSITKFVTSKDITSKVDIVTRAEQFVQSTKELLFQFKPSEVYNSDQSPFTYELEPKRTLSTKGERVTYGFVNSMSKITHSYSSMPIISMEGKLLSPTFLCLQEKDGIFGPKVQAQVDQLAITYPNVYVTCSKSGKLDKKKMKEWVTGCLNPNIETKCLLLLDAWTGQRDSQIYEEIKDLCTRLEIPPKTTEYIQPLDRYFFRQYKILRKKIWERLQLDGLSDQFHRRENIVKLHSIIHDQLSSPRFEKMIRFAWSDCGYTGKSTERFENVLDVCFPPPTGDNIICQIAQCSETIFIRCSHCNIYMCINHFFEKFHAHIP